MTKSFIATSAKCVFISVSIFLLGYLVVKNLVPGGRFEATYAFEPTPFISALRPAERLSKFKEGHEQSIIGDPIYFDVRLPSSFENIEIVLKYKNLTEQKFTVAAFTNRQNWKFRISDLNVTPLNDDFLEGRVHFSTEGLDILNRTITFILGAPKASEENPITVYGMDVIAAKQSLTWRQIPRKLWESLIKAVKRRL